MPRGKQPDRSIYQATLPNTLLNDLRLLSAITGETSQELVERAIFDLIDSRVQASRSLADMFEAARRLREKPSSSE